MKTKNFCTYAVVLSALVTPVMHSMQSEAQSSTEEPCSVAIVGTIIADGLIAHPFSFFLEKQDPCAEITLSDGSKPWLSTTDLEIYLTEKNYTVASGAQILQANFRQPDGLCYEIDFDKTCKWNLILLEETKGIFDKTIASLELIAAEISKAEICRKTLLDSPLPSEGENTRLVENIDRLRRQETAITEHQFAILETLGQQSLALKKYICHELCPVALRISTALSMAEIFLDVNQFETLAAAHYWIDFAQKYYTPGTLSPEWTALYNFLRAQKERMDGNKETALEILKTIRPKFLSQKHNAQRDLSLAEADLCVLPASLAPEHYKTLVAIQTHLDRAHIAALDANKRSILSPLETATLKDYRIKAASLFDFLCALRYLPSDAAVAHVFESLQKINSRFLSKRNLAQKDLWLTGYYIHHLLPEVGPEQRKQLTEASEHLSWAQAESAEPTGSNFSPEEQKLCAAYRNVLEKYLAPYK